MYHQGQCGVRQHLQRLQEHTGEDDGFVILWFFLKKFFRSASFLFDFVLHFLNEEWGRKD